MAPPLLRFVKQFHRGTWFSDASLEAVGGLCLWTVVRWRYTMTKEEI